MIKCVWLWVFGLWAWAAMAVGLPSQAVFSYNGVLWFVADAETFTPMQAFEKEQQLISDNMVIYRLSHQGEAARFISAQTQNTPIVPIKKEDRLFLPINAESIQVKDPLTQEVLVIFPQADVFIPRTIDTLEVKFPATRAGVAVVIKKDLVRFEKTSDGVEIIFNRNFPLTQDVPFVPALRKGALDFSEEKQKEPSWFAQETQKMRTLVDCLSASQSGMLKLELSRLYLSQGLVPEALSILNTLRVDDALALKGLALWLNNQTEEAAKVWQNPYLKTDPTVLAWLRAIQAHFTENKIGVLRDQTPDALLADALLVALRQEPSNQNIINALSGLPLDKYQEQHFALLRGRLAAKPIRDLSPEQCQLRFQQLMDSIQHRAPTTAIAELEMLRLAYPAPEFIEQVNAALLPLYKQTHDYVSALPLCSPDERQALLQEGMSALQTPFERLTLWYAFDELEGVLPEAEAVRQKITDDYLSLDLPDEASRFQARQLQ